MTKPKRANIQFQARDGEIIAFVDGSYLGPVEVRRAEYDGGVFVHIPPHVLRQSNIGVLSEPGDIDQVE